MENIFDLWAKIKNYIHSKPNRVYYKEREIWWCHLGFNIGDESNGKHDSFERPILVVRGFNKELLWGVPLSKQIKPDNKYYIPLNEGSVMISQLRVISSRRLIRKISTISQEDFSRIKKEIKSLL